MYIYNFISIIFRDTYHIHRFISRPEMVFFITSYNYKFNHDIISTFFIVANNDGKNSIVRLKNVFVKKHANLSYIVQLAYSAIIVARVLSIFTRMFLHRIFKFIQSRLKTHIAYMQKLKKRPTFKCAGLHIFHCRHICEE